MLDNWYDDGEGSEKCIRECRKAEMKHKAKIAQSVFDTFECLRWESELEEAKAENDRLKKAVKKWKDKYYDILSPTYANALRDAKTEIARLKSDLTGTAFALSDHSAENIQLRKDIDQMEERLFKYGRCLPDCTGKYTGGNCNCGWETILKESF